MLTSKTPQLLSGRLPRRTSVLCALCRVQFFNTSGCFTIARIPGNLFLVFCIHFDSVLTRTQTTVIIRANKFYFAYKRNQFFFNVESGIRQQCSANYCRLHFCVVCIAVLIIIFIITEPFAKEFKEIKKKVGFKVTIEMCGDGGITVWHFTVRRTGKNGCSLLVLQASIASTR